MTTASIESEFRRVIKAVAALSDVDTKLAQCQTIDEVEDNIRIHCQAIQSYARQHDDLGPMLTWAKDCAGKCQQRITELQYAKNAKKIAKSIEVTDFASPQINKNYKREVELVATAPEII